MQHHENLEIYKKSFYIMDKFLCVLFFSSCRSVFDLTSICFGMHSPEEDEAAETGVDAPQVDATGSFAFQSDLSAPQGGFNFGGQ